MTRAIRDNGESGEWTDLQTSEEKAHEALNIEIGTVCFSIVDFWNEVPPSGAWILKRSLVLRRLTG
jgi:hypothetical protein